MFIIRSTQGAGQDGTQKGRPDDRPVQPQKPTTLIQRASHINVMNRLPHQRKIFFYTGGQNRIAASVSRAPMCPGVCW